MADISVNKEHDLDKAELKSRLDDLVEHLTSRYGLKAVWSDDTCTLTGTGLKKAVLVMRDGSVSLDINLGMMGRMFKPQVEREVTRWVEKILYT